MKYDALGDRGHVIFDRGYVWGSYNSGAYWLSSVRDVNGRSQAFLDSHHIYHKKRTVTFY